MAGFQTATNPDVRMGLVTIFPWLVAHTTAAYKELRGELIEVYAHGGGVMAKADPASKDAAPKAKSKKTQAPKSFSPAKKTALKNPAHSKPKKRKGKPER